MPRPPIMPYAHPPNNFRLSVRHPSLILTQLQTAGADVETISQGEIEERINEVVSHFLEARQHSVSKPAFRSEVKALRKVLDGLLDGLPDDYSPLAAELAKHWQYAPVLNCRQRGVDEIAVVGEQTPIAHLRAELLRFSKGLNALAVDVGVGKAGRVEALEEHEFVGALATLFSEWTGQVRSQWAQEEPENPEDRATGPLPDFVRAVLSETRKQMIDRLRHQGKMVGRGKFEPLTAVEAESLVGPIELTTNLSSLIVALALK